MIVTTEGSAVTGMPVPVRLGSGKGRFTGRWRGGEPVADGARLEVELSVDDTVDWSDIVLDQPCVDSLLGMPDDRAVRICGHIVDLDELDVLVLRVADGSIMIDTEGDAPAEPAGRTASLVVACVDIFPTGS